MTKAAASGNTGGPGVGQWQFSSPGFWGRDKQNPLR